MEFTFSNKRWLTKEEIKNEDKIIDKNALGFHVPGMFDKVINLEKCHLQEEPSNKIRNSVREFALKNNLTFFDIRNQEGLLRNLMIRTSRNNQLMVLVQFYHDDSKKIKLLMNFIKNSFKEITSLLYTINTKANNTIYDQKIICFDGNDHITENIEDLIFKIGPKSFFQTNSEQAEILYRSARDLADIKKEDIVYDLYTGTGTIAQFVARDAKRVIGIDSVVEAIEAAKESAKFNDIKNCDFFSGDMKNIFTDEFITQNGKPHLIITDPPRDGMHKKVIEQIKKIKPKKIIYISCNSATQSRDISLFNDLYEIKNMQTVDMFPQTHHVENILILELR
jgi:23S rRNA (uracil1939-C5)-methyltransferase